MLVDRLFYLEKILLYKDTKTIKVITGMRRSGKSFLLLSYKNYLLEHGIEEKQVIYLNFESLSTYQYRDFLSLYQYLQGKIDKNQRYYLLFDEIGQVKDWQRVITSLTVDYDVDITITGSNAHLLSSDLATLIAGRYVEIPIYPLCFQEFILFFDKFLPDNQKTLEEKFLDFMKYGGLPVIFQHQWDESVFNSLLLGIYDSVVRRDILEHNSINDILSFNQTTNYLLDSIGNIISAKNVSNVLKQRDNKISHNTVIKYAEMLISAFVFYKVQRYDIKGKNYLRTNHKFYVADLGIRNAVLGYHNIDMGAMLENIVYLELKRRGYQIAIGMLRYAEIDFIASSQMNKYYIQVSYSIQHEDTLAREVNAFKYVKDEYPKIIITNDKVLTSDLNGVKIVNVIDFLLNDKIE